ncbi:MtrAB system histidine kinase MtrB [Parenemella sanctibonifatiensis]|uniref:MtrAB system histidine kinase MtrB n=1 Tax=Parenemella sanctibonifatiensis TaxID=2016505 RepID=UPI002B4BA589|nr:MtrAB system histidine kinase MtrB [Parenemella sanctibonifatiensis]
MPLRVVGGTLVLSTVISLLGGWFLVGQARQGVLEGKERTAVAEATTALDNAQRQLRSSELRTSNVNERLTQLAFDVAAQGHASGQYQVVLEGPVSDIYSGRISPTSVPAGLREEVGTSGGMVMTYTSIDYTDQSAAEPGLVVGGVLVAPGVGRFPVYFIFPLSQEVDTLRVMQQAVITTVALLIVAMTGVAFLISQQVVAPIRRARRAAESLASGHWEDRMEVKGTDDLASLADSMNNMASELHKQITQLEDLSRVQQRFVSDVSHELRTPLTTVRMAAEMMYEGRDELDPMMARCAELLYDELDRFEELLSDLLEISRFDAGAAVLTLEETDLVTVVLAEVAAQEAFAQRQGCELRTHLPASCTAEVDERRVRRILRNLITNAIEHGEQRPIDIRLVATEEAAAIAVRDHGIGFQASQVRQVFVRFWRADPSRARTVGGNGLGLAISMEDALLHGGWLNAWGRPGQGAQFRLTLPRHAGVDLTVSPMPVMPQDLTESVEAKR